MEIRIRETGAVVSEIEFKQLHPNTSFPRILSESILNEFGADLVLEGPQPTTTIYQTVIRDGVELIGDKYYTKYVIGPAFETQEEEDAYVASIDTNLRNSKLTQIITERERRLSLGFDYDFNDVRGIHHIGTTVQDMKGWDEVSAIASATINLGFPETPISIATETGIVNITAIEWQSILVASAQFRQPIWAGSFYLTSLPVIPDDFTNDVYWTS